MQVFTLAVMTLIIIPSSGLTLNFYEGNVLSKKKKNANCSASGIFMQELH
jgi:hypothetical protein